MSAFVVEGETKPPKRFTESSLLAAMENIDRVIEDKELKSHVKERGLGTPATRAAIIEELISAGYIKRSGRQLVSTDYGRNFVDSLPENVKSAEMTARWEQSLSDIEKGQISPEILLSEIEKTVADIVEFEKNNSNHAAVNRKKVVGKCTRCGGSVVETGKGFACTAGREKCGFFIFKHDKRIGRCYTAAEISELLAKRRVTLENCISSKGNRYNAMFTLEETGEYVNLKFAAYTGSKKKRM